jgi:hypothetical protein
MTPQRETPGQSSGRHTSKPWEPGEEEEARQRIRDEVAKGKPYVVKNMDALEVEILSVAIKGGEEIAVTLLFRGVVVRPEATAKVNIAVSVSVPADVERGDDATG